MKDETPGTNSVEVGKRVKLLSTAAIQEANEVVLGMRDNLERVMTQKFWHKQVPMRDKLLYYPHSLRREEAYPNNSLPMNHCGRPECECYKKQCCCQFYNLNRREQCPCKVHGCSENPVQEKKFFCSTTDADKHEDGCASVKGTTTKMKRISTPDGGWADVPIPPEAGEWEEECESLIIRAGLHLGYKQRSRIDEVKSFFRSQIELAEKRGKEDALHFMDATIRADEIRAQERSRISEAIGKLFGDESCETCVRTNPMPRKSYHHLRFCFI